MSGDTNLEEIKSKSKLWIALGGCIIALLVIFVFIALPLLGGWLVLGNLGTCTPVSDFYSVAGLQTDGKPSNLPIHSKLIKATGKGCLPRTIAGSSENYEPLDLVIATSDPNATKQEYRSRLEKNGWKPLGGKSNQYFKNAQVAPSDSVGGPPKIISEGGSFVVEETSRPQSLGWGQRVQLTAMHGEKYLHIHAQVNKEGLNQALVDVSKSPQPSSKSHVQGGCGNLLGVNLVKPPDGGYIDHQPTVEGTSESPNAVIDIRIDGNDYLMPAERATGKYDPTTHVKTDEQGSFSFALDLTGDRVVATGPEETGIVPAAGVALGEHRFMVVVNDAPGCLPTSRVVKAVLR